jgi:pyruvate dehydrogenase E2 component (dihydrolipoamide acetyltransferase)
MDGCRRGGSVLSSGSSKGETRVQQPTPAEQAIARRSAESRATVPDMELRVAVDMRACIQLHERDGTSTTAMLARACALALAEHPRANGAYRDGRFELYSRVNVGLVLASEDAYLIPTVFDADQKTVAELTAEIDEIAQAAQSGRLASPAFSGATFTLWDAGELGVLSVTIPVNPPQAAAITAGMITDASLVLTLSCDHRILYGASAARLLAGVRSRLELAAL